MRKNFSLVVKSNSYYIIYDGFFYFVIENVYVYLYFDVKCNKVKCNGESIL